MFMAMSGDLEARDVGTGTGTRNGICAALICTPGEANEKHND